MQEIEVRVIKYIRNVARRRRRDAKTVEMIEKEAGRSYKLQI